MKHFIDKDTGVYNGSGDNNTFMSGVVVRDLTEEDLEKLRKGAKWDFEKNTIIETEEYTTHIQEEQKQKDIEEMKEISKKSENLRTKYITAELLPEGEIRTAILTSLETKTEENSNLFLSKFSNFKEKYGEDPIQYII